MTLIDKKIAKTHDDVLEEIAKEIDIPPSLVEEAMSRYESLGKWLDRGGSTIAQYDPAISPQGSFLLGTVTKPEAEEEYDVDLICVLQAEKKDFTPKALKVAVGHEVKLYAAAQNMKKPPEEGRRCWTLHYAKKTRFHMDVLPSLPDAQAHRLLLEQKGYTDLAQDFSLSGAAIAITDWTLPQYEKITEDWPLSNPIGYAAWFKSRMLSQLIARKTLLKESQMITASVDEIPDYKVKTPLQQSIQLLKRHRDTMFADDPEHKPISIIITTLAAHAYNEEESISNALQSILINMDRYIEYRGQEAWVMNPVNPEENFADKWPEEPKKRKNFFNWLEQARHDFARYLRASRFDEMPDILKEGLGSKTVDRALGAVLVGTAASIAAPAIVRASAKDGRAEAAIAAIQQRGPQSKPWAG